MKKVGITGGIGSGKSHICRLFEGLGYPVFYTDKVSKDIMTNNTLIKSYIIENYGEESYSGDTINSKH